MQPITIQIPGEDQPRTFQPDDSVPPKIAAIILGGCRPISEQTLASWRSRRDDGPRYCNISASGKGGRVSYLVRDLLAWLEARRAA